MPWSVDGISLSNLAWNIKNRSAGWSMPSKSEGNLRIPGAHGSKWVADKTFDEGHLSLSMWAAGTNEDGTLPFSEDGRKKIRENLDKLTSIFGNTNRLLCIRQSDSDQISMVNELTNPTLRDTASNGQVLAVDGMRGNQFHTKAVEISRNVSYNPYVQGRTADNVIATEDLYPDPTFRRHQGDGSQYYLRSYYYPIQQNVAFTNPFFRGLNSFNWYTGYSGRGVIKSGVAIKYPSRVWIGELTVKCSGYRQRRTIFYQSIKLADEVAAQSSVVYKITPQASIDGVTWKTGTAQTYTLTKDNPTEVLIPQTALPDIGAGTGFYVRYQMEFPNGITVPKSDVLDIYRTAVQDGMHEANPRRNTLTRDLFIDGGPTPYIDVTGEKDKSWSVFKAAGAPEWTTVITNSANTTACYAYPWHFRQVRTGSDIANLAFSVFGGSQNTFRRILPIPKYTMNGVRIWGKTTAYTKRACALRIMRMTWTGSAYTYAKVADVSVTGSGWFSSTPFTINGGAKYCIEVDVPSSYNGLEPGVTFQELHVSNGLVQTVLPAGASSITHGPSSRAYYAGTIYDSTILGVTGPVPYYKKAMPQRATELFSNKSVAWAKSPTGAVDIDGKIESGTWNIRGTGFTPRTVTVRFKANVSTLEHLVPAVKFPTSNQNVTASLRFHDSTGKVLRTVTQSFNTLSRAANWFQFSAAVNNANETNVSVLFETPVGKSWAFSQLFLQECHVFTNLPNTITSFTGDSLSESTEWPVASNWGPNPRFSYSSLTVQVPTGWYVDGIIGFDTAPVGDALRTLDSNPVFYTTLPPGKAFVGFRRGSYTGDFTVSVRVNDTGTPVSLGSITSSKDYVQGVVDVPAGGGSKIGFVFGGTAPAYYTIRDAFAIHSWASSFPTSTATAWGSIEDSTSASKLQLPTHPSSVLPFLRNEWRASDESTILYAGPVQGWDGPVLGGGYLPLPPTGVNSVVTSSPVAVNKGYVSYATQISVQALGAGRISIDLQGATATQFAKGEWNTLKSTPVSSTGVQTTKVTDVAVGDKTRVRLAVVVNNTSSPNSTTGIVGILTDSTLTPSILPLGSNFPGIFTGVRGFDGKTEYVGNVRQCFAEVVDGIDMESMAYGQLAEFTVDLVVPDAFWEDAYDTSAYISTTGTSSSLVMEAFAGATAPMTDLRWSITPVSGSITSLTFTDLGSGTEWTYSGPARTKLTIDSGNFTALGEDNKSVMRYVTVNSAQFLPLTPYWRGLGQASPGALGTPILNWRANTAIKIQVTGRRKYFIS